MSISVNYSVVSNKALQAKIIDFAHSNTLRTDE